MTVWQAASSDQSSPSSRLEKAKKSREAVTWQKVRMLISSGMYLPAETIRNGQKRPETVAEVCRAMPRVWSAGCQQMGAPDPRSEYELDPRDVDTEVGLQRAQPSRRREFCHSAAPPLPLVGASIAMERERQLNDSLANGELSRKSRSIRTARNATEAVEPPAASMTLPARNPR